MTGATRHCRTCDLLKPVDRFYTGDTQCKDCKAAYQRERTARLKAGTWIPRAANKGCNNAVLPSPPGRAADGTRAKLNPKPERLPPAGGDPIGKVWLEIMRGIHRATVPADPEERTTA